MCLTGWTQDQYFTIKTCRWDVFYVGCSRPHSTFTRWYTTGYQWCDVSLSFDVKKYIWNTTRFDTCVAVESSLDFLDLGYFLSWMWYLTQIKRYKDTWRLPIANVAFSYAGPGLSEIMLNPSMNWTEQKFIHTNNHEHV